MKLVTMTSAFTKVFGFEKTIDLLAEAGFDALDFSAAHAEEFYTDVHPDSYYIEMRKRAEAHGISFAQAHAPYTSIKEQAEENERQVITAMKNAALLGAENIVVHPLQHYRYREAWAPEKLFEENMAFYRRLLPYAEEYGIRVCTENMYQGDMYILCVHSTCSRPEEMIRYFDEINHPLFGCCLDIGHTSLVREDAANFIRALGKQRLCCLHVHDVDEGRDKHVVPYFGGAIAWDRVMAALAGIGYEGNFTYETDYFLYPLPHAVLPAAARFMAAIGHTMIDKINAMR